MKNRLPSAGQIAALVVVCTGAAFAYIAHGYPQGSMLRPGPGFLPFYIGLLMALLGGMVLIGERNSPATEDGETPAASMRPVIAISAGMIILALLLERLGFIPAVAAMFLCIGFAERQQSWLPLLGVCVFMIVFGIAVFIWGLGVPISVIGAT